MKPEQDVSRRRFPSKAREGGFALILSLITVLAISTLAVGMLYNAHKGKRTAENYRHRMQGFHAADGIVSLLGQEALDGRSGIYISGTGMGTVTGEYWEGLSGTNVLSFKSSLLGLPSPTRIVNSEYLGGYFKGKTNFGIRWKGYIVPPVSGTYTFFLMSQGQSAFYLSTDETTAKLSTAPIALLTTSVTTWQENGEGASAPRVLEVGKAYYFEYLHKHGSSGTGIGHVGWKGPHFLDQRPIAGTRLASSPEAGQAVPDSARLGDMGLAYQLTRISDQVFGVSVDAFRPGILGRTGFRLPLRQVLNLNGMTGALPDTQWLRVIYYDYSSSGSNPEFQFTTGLQVVKGMVKPTTLRYTTLDADYFGFDSIPKPVVSASPRRNCMIEKWFTPWTPGDFYAPSYAWAAIPIARPS